MMKITRIAAQNGNRALVGFVMLSLLLSLTTGSLAQSTTASVLGVAADANGASVSGATITIRNVQTNAARSVTTDGEGRFFIGELAPGEYEVSAEHQGFRKELRQGIVLTVGREAVVNFSLEVGAVTDQVIITGDAPLVNTTTSEISALVNERTIKELPLNGRDLFQLATLQIGVVNAGSLTADPLNSGTGGVKMSINGGRITFNNFLLDGATVNEVQNTTPGSVAGGFTGVDAVQEFQLLTNNYSAEFGGAGGGIVNIVSKSGGNQLHGTAFEFARNSALDARNFFDQESVPPFSRNQFGGSIGGPIRRDKTFIFGAYEGFRQSLTESQRFFVPTDDARNGIGVDPAGPITVAASIKPYLALYPRPNAGDIGGGLGAFIRGDSGQTNEDYFSIRLDQNFSSKDTLFGRYTFDNSSSTKPNHVISNTALQGRNQYVGLGETHIFNSRLLNNVRIAYARSKVFGDEVDVSPVPQSLVWVPGQTVLGSFVDIGGLSPLSERILVPRFLIQNNIQVTEQLAYTRGAHSIKIGFSELRTQLNAVSTDIPAGAYIFGSYENFLKGKTQIFAAPLASANDAYRGIRTWSTGAYFQDDWKVRGNFTLNLGLRYEPITSPDEVNGKLSNLRDIVHDTKPTLGAPFFKNNTLKNFAPRLGFAWDITGDGKTSLRGGYGIFYVQPLPYAYRFEMSGIEPFFIIGLAFGSVFGAPESFPNSFPNLANFPGAIAATVYDFDPSTSYVQQWNLSVQREFFGGFTATAAYVGSRGIHLATNGNRNTAANFTLLPDGEKQFPVAGSNPLRNPAFGPIRQQTHNADSYYHALQVNLARRFANGLQLQAAYTFSKSIDTASDSLGIYSLQSVQLAQDPFNLRGEKGLSAFDVRHNFSLNATYLLPYQTQSGAHGGRKVADFFFGGWEANTIITAHSGTPFNPTISFNNSNDGNQDNVERPDWVAGATPGSAVTGDPQHFIDPKAFTIAPAGQFGNTGRNVLIGPGLFSVDLSLLKSNKIGERATVQFRAEVFNLFNRANFALPDILTVFEQGGTTPSNFGQITRTTTTSRQLQFGVKFIF
jgi:outer membrane receptor protein involved in Fe transport